MKDFEFSIWGGLFVKHGTPDQAMDALREASIAVLADPEVRSRYETEGRIPFEPMSKEQVKEMQGSQIATYRSLIKELGFKTN